VTKILLILAVSHGLLLAQKSIELPRVGVLDYYGLRKIKPERIQRILATREGDPFPASKGDVEERIERIPGIARSHLEAVCCDGGKTVLFVGIEEVGAPAFPFRTAPTGDVRLPEEMIDTYRKFLDAADRAARAGKALEDLSSGNALMADPAGRGLQQRFAAYASEQTALLRDVLRNSADEEHRAIAAYIIGYAPDKKTIVNDLQVAVQDPEGNVRHNAMRSMAAIMALAAKNPDSGIQISAVWFVEMLNSIVWSDRHKATLTLLNLTEGRPENVLALIRERATPALAEMARWKSLTHALPPYMLLCRVAGMSDDEIERSWTGGDREAVIARALKAKRK
jgi:hypothetical protein